MGSTGGSVERRPVSFRWRSTNCYAQPHTTTLRQPLREAGFALLTHRRVRLDVGCGGGLGVLGGSVRDELSGMFLGGVAVIVATVGSDGRPVITRGWGLRYEEASSTLTLAVTAPAGSPTLANLESNRAIAVTVSEPLTYRTVQLKGVVDHIGAPSQEDRTWAHEHLDRFVAEVAKLGITSGADKLFLGDLRLVRFPVAEFFDQTPGPDAGRRLE